MDYIDVGFSGGDTLVDKIIQGVSGAFEENVTHAFVMLFDRPFEALGIMVGDELYPQARFRWRDKYDGNDTVKFIRIEVPDIQALIDEAFKLDGTPYGYSDCISTGLKILLHADVLEDGTKSVMCAELVVRLLRAGGVGICSDLEPDQVAPVVLYRELIHNFNGIDVTDDYKK